MKHETVNTETHNESPVSPELVDTLVVRFYSNTKAADNIKAPVAFYSLGLPSPLQGLTLNGTIFAERDLRGSVKGYNAPMPGRSRFGDHAISPAPLILMGADGTEHRAKDSVDADGARLADNWEPKLVEAFYRFQKTGAQLQAVRF
jgi:hypothetical protein